MLVCSLPNLYFPERALSVKDYCRVFAQSLVNRLWDSCANSITCADLIADFVHGGGQGSISQFALNLMRATAVELDAVGHSKNHRYHHSFVR